MSGRAAWSWMAVGGALLMCAGCGFKGPLYLPERNTTVITHTARPALAAPSDGQTQAPGAAPTPATKKKTKTSPTSQSPNSPTPPPQ